MTTSEYKCPNCGGPVAFSPGTGEVACPYCDTVISIEAFGFMQEDTAQAADNGRDAAWSHDGSRWSGQELEGLVVYICSSCSGEIVGERTLGAATCPFCGSAVMIKEAFGGALRPDLIIPFQYDRQHALDSLQNHYANKKLLPAVFKEHNHISGVKGVYIPFWLYDAHTQAHIEYRGRRIRTWSDRNYIYTETSHYQIIREGTLGFGSVPADGSEKVDDTLMESIEPYDISGAQPFSSAYLAGFYANKYDLDAEQCSPRVNERVRNSTIAEFAKTVTGFTGVTPVRTDIRVNCSSVRYALLPAWLLGSAWEGRSFTFAMNGQTGRFVGDLPLDKAKRRRLYWTMAGIIAAALLLLTQGYIALFM